MSWLSTVFSNVALAALMTLAAWIVQRHLNRPAVARVLWVLVLVKLVTPPLVSLPLGAATGTPNCLAGTCACGVHSEPESFLPIALAWTLLATWTAGAGATLLLTLRRWMRFHRLIAHARPAPQPWQDLAARLAADLSMRRPPEILAVPGRLPPLVMAGWRRPRMLLPSALMSQLNAAQSEALLLHELIHVHRGDHLVRVLEVAVGVVYWWLPLVGSIGRRLRACEEASCDAAVVARLPQARREYARLLLDVVDFADPLPRQGVPQATAMSAAECLQQRLQTILDTSHRAPRQRPIGAMTVAIASCVLLPCELRLGTVRRVPVEPPAAAEASLELEQGVEAVPRPIADRQLEFLEFCCPS